MTKTPSAAVVRPTRSATMTLRDRDDVHITVDDIDRTSPFLLLHGGGGPLTMTGFAHQLAERTHARVLLPTHPGFGGTARPDTLASTRDLAAAYVELIDQLDLADLTLIGNSFGGWLAAEIALLGSPGSGESSSWTVSVCRSTATRPPTCVASPPPNWPPCRSTNRPSPRRRGLWEAADRAPTSRPSWRMRGRR
ncbi:alpha/beta fold hydrolase [Allobranchiibius sp. GilTou73]|uniref:alpha/beta fold hydrolase n=1 Tax=Allobranchiibius sp. GilTou73 TaxID=2904523 RepID=UPI001F3D3CB8|nr:alpha/beta fold hydrolase [Allobranchiibius sp. GilTou73]UIJ35509.1 alpha/beta hydrolase [Allobranchiibius sp. GilTou73]